jgi:ABC-type multidrug transport system fused ATPase/permease subunit
MQASITSTVIIEMDISRLKTQFFVDILVAVILIWLEIGPLALLAIGAVILVLPVNFILGRKIGIYRSRTQINLDNRSKLTNELLQSMRVIKFYAWERAFRDRILRAREIELRNIRKLGIVRMFMLWVLAIGPNVGLGIDLI